MEFVEDAILETETFPGTPTINLGEKTAGHVKLLYKQYDEQKVMIAWENVLFLACK